MHRTIGMLVAACLALQPVASAADMVSPKMFQLLLKNRISEQGRLPPEQRGLYAFLCPGSLNVFLMNPSGPAIPEPARVQSALHYFGQDPGPVDGVPGRRTEAAAKAYARALLNRGSACLTAEALVAMVAAHDWARAQPRADMEALTAAHGPLGPVRAYYNRDLPAPHIRTARENDSCGAHDNAHLLGEVFGSADRAGTGARQLRVSSVLSPGPMTMDLRPERLNLRLDAFDRVYEISCG